MFTSTSSVCGNSHMCPFSIKSSPINTYQIRFVRPKIKQYLKYLIFIILSTILICTYPPRIKNLYRDITQRTSNHNPIKNAKGPLTYLGVKLLGRLGNNMFQIASCFGISRKSGRKPYIMTSMDMDPYIFDSFIPLKPFELKGDFGDINSSTLREHLPGTFDPSITLATGASPDPYITVGEYLQSWKYFDGVGGEIRNLFTFNGQIAKESIGILNFVKRYVLYKNRKGGMDDERSLEHYRKYLTFSRDIRSGMIQELMGSHYDEPYHIKLKFLTELQINLPTLKNYVQTSKNKSHSMANNTSSFEVDMNFSEYANIWSGRTLKSDGSVIQTSFHNLNTMENITFIGVHIRRGDFKKFSVRNTATLKWIHRAMSYYEKRYAGCVFVVCSDEPGWVRRHLSLLPFESVFVANRKPGEDMSLLSHCNHSIFTVGSFGWWSGWLTKGETVYMKDFTPQGSWLDEEYQNSDYFLPKWIPL